MELRIPLSTKFKRLYLHHFENALPKIGRIFELRSEFWSATPAWILLQYSLTAGKPFSIAKVARNVTEKCALGWVAVLSSVQYLELLFYFIEIGNIRLGIRAIIHWGRVWNKNAHIYVTLTFLTKYNFTYFPTIFFWVPSVVDVVCTYTLFLHPPTRLHPLRVRYCRIL